MMKRQTRVLIQAVLIALIVLSVALTVGAIPAPTDPPPQHVLLEDGGTVYILGNCPHMAIDVNGADSLQVTCKTEK